MTDINPTPSWAAVRQLETNEFATGGANGNMNEQAKSLAARSELLKQYAALPYESKTGGYALNERVQLATGDIVRSTIPSNVKNPNVDMTGWKPTKDSNVITTVESIADLIAIQNPKDDQVVFVSSSGADYHFIGSEWVLIGGGESVNLLSVYGGINDFGVAIELAYAKAKTLGLSTIFIPTRNYTAKTTADITLDSNFSFEFSSNITINVMNEVDVFNIKQADRFLKVDANNANFSPKWGANTNNGASIFKLESRTLSKSGVYSGIRTKSIGDAKFKSGVDSVGLNYALIEKCLIQAINPIVNASSLDGVGHSMGSIVKDCFLHADNDIGTPLTLINNSTLACEGWSIEGGEHFGRTGVKVINNLTSSGYYSPLLRYANVHMNCVRFAELEGVARVQFDGCDLQAQVIKDNPYSGLFELTGVQAFTLGAGTTITQALPVGATAEDSIAVLSFKNSSRGQVSAFASIEGSKIWLTQAAPLVKFESEGCYNGTVDLGILNLGAFTGKFSDIGFENKVNGSSDTRLSNSTVGGGVSFGDKASFDSATGFLTLGGAPIFGETYSIPASVVPNNATINRIVPVDSIGKSFEIIFESSNITLNHNASLLLPASTPLKLLYSSVIQVYSYNNQWCRVSQVNQNTSMLVTGAVPPTTGASGVHGQKIFSAGFVYEYIAETGWVKYEAATF